MLKVSDITVSIQRATILRNVHLAIPRGQTAGLIGRNGAGKTTLMRSIMGLIPLEAGAIAVNGQTLTTVPAHARAMLGIGYMPEDRRLVPDFTVEENVLLPVWATGRRDSAPRLRWIYELMPEVARLAARKTLALSGGQQKLVALARALMCGFHLLLLDEPFEGVAPVLAQRLAEVIGNLRGEGLSVLLSESDYTHSAELVDHLFVIERGVVEERTARAGRGANAIATGIQP